MTVVVGTAGHIDHGKTTLLRALTGIDADRLPEERARGMTIDVGYAHLALADGTEIDFVDVPGHDRLVGNMLVGAGEIDAALLVIAADDGPRAQTREHLELLDALGVGDGLIVVTKIDAVDGRRVDEVVAAARALVASTSLRSVPVLAASATTGLGLEAVVRALTELRDRIARRVAVAAPSAAASAAASDTAAGQPATGATSLAIDRVFTIRGRGTVVTGTLRGAPVERGAILGAVPGAAGLRVRVREVQVHGRTLDRAGPGRVALNVAGDGIDGLERGTVLTTDAAVVATDRLHVALRPVATLDGRVVGAPAGIGGSRRTAGRVPADRTPIMVHAGTARISGIVARSGRDDVDLGGGERSAILRLDRPIAIAAGDRFIVRRASPVETLGGGRVLDPCPARGVARRRTSPERVTALAQAAAGSAAWRSARLDLHGAIDGGSPGLAPDVAAAVDDALLAAVETQPGVRMAELVRAGESALRRAVGTVRRAAPAAGAATSNPARRLVSSRIDGLVDTGRLRKDLDRLRPAGTDPAAPDPAITAAMDRLVAALSSNSPPSLVVAAREAGCPPDGVRRLEAAGRIVRLDDDLAWAEPTWRALALRALDLARRGPLTPAALRDSSGSSRKYVMALLEDLDRRAILRRTDAGHVPGPRAGLLADVADPGSLGAAPASRAGAGR